MGQRNNRQDAAHKANNDAMPANKHATPSHFPVVRLLWHTHYEMLTIAIYNGVCTATDFRILTNGIFTQGTMTQDCCYEI